jgi:hypothetical protein
MPSLVSIPILSYNSNLIYLLSILPPCTYSQKLIYILGENFYEADLNSMGIELVSEQYLLFFSIGGILLYLVMFVIFDRMLPSEFGVKEPLFPSLFNIRDNDCNKFVKNDEEEVSIKIQNLTKQYGDVIALNNFSVNINQNQI